MTSRERKEQPAGDPDSRLRGNDKQRMGRTSNGRPWQQTLHLLPQYPIASDGWPLPTALPPFTPSRHACLPGGHGAGLGSHCGLGSRIFLLFPHFSVTPALLYHSRTSLSFLYFSVIPVSFYHPRIPLSALYFSVIPVFLCFSCIFLFSPHFFCHSRAGGNPSWDLNAWIPAFAGMTNRGQEEQTKNGKNKPGQGLLCQSRPRDGHKAN
jgi:hypothetical protein